MIEGREKESNRFAVSKWTGGNVPGFMVCDGRWKLMLGRNADSRSVDALYGLKNDPHEMTNLIGATNPSREKYRAEAERTKKLLVNWLEEIKSPRMSEVKARRFQ